MVKKTLHFFDKIKGPEWARPEMGMLRKLIERVRVLT